MPAVLVLFGSSGKNQQGMGAATGPMQSISSLMASLSGEFEFTLVACVANSNRSSDYVGDPVDWEKVDTNRVWVARSVSRWRLVRKILADQRFDLLILNSFFDREFTIPVLILNRFVSRRRIRIIVSPRGELSAGALSLKSVQKRVWLWMVKQLALFEGVWIHATALHEVEDIKRCDLEQKAILFAPNIPSINKIPTAKLYGRLKPACEELRLVLVGRIAPVKNIDYALRVLSSLRTPVNLDIIGPVEDKEYWEKCKKLINALPQNIKVEAKGVVPHEALSASLLDYDLFFLPTKGENFGHAIFEALSASLPVLISDRTPWVGLYDMNAGWDLTLEQPDAFADAIRSFSRMNVEERNRLKCGARETAIRTNEEVDAVKQNRSMINAALGIGDAP